MIAFITIGTLHPLVGIAIPLSDIPYQTIVGVSSLLDVIYGGKPLVVNWQWFNQLFNQ